MKRLSIILLLTLMFFPLRAADDARHAVINIITYKADGSILGSGYGFYIAEDGTAVAPYALFNGAHRADVIDSKGKKSQVHRILGASSTLDIVKFNTTAKKLQCLTPDTVMAKTGNALSLVFYTNDKKAQPVAATVTKVDTYADYGYYTISAPNEDRYQGCPLINAEGKVVAIVQKNVSRDATTACALDIRSARELKISSLSFAVSDLKSIRMPKALPKNESDALTFLYMMNTADSALAETAYADFISAFPDNADGYVNRANFHAAYGRYDLCEADYEKALQCGTSQAETHYSLSKTVYTHAVAKPGGFRENWTLERAEAEAARAFELQPHPLYAMQRGNCFFALRQYDKAAEHFEQACHMFDTLSQGGGASPENYFYAARSLELAGGDSLRVLALLDSAVARCAKPYTPASARFLLERAQRLVALGEYRKAVFDYNDYERAIGADKMGDRFFYLREQAELQARMYQQALDDIRSAITLNSSEMLYRIEEALILLRAGLYDEAIKAAQNTLTLLPENPDCYKIIGIAHGELGHKAKAVEALNKAIELGDETAQPFLQKYQ